MRKICLGIVAAMLILSGCTVPVKTVKGDYHFLKNVKELKVEFDYSDMMVGRNLPEERYVSERVEERNEDDPGKGDAWKEGWYGARDKRYEPKFMEQFSSYLEDTGINASEENEDAPYTLIVHTVYTEPGFNVGVMKKPAEVNFEYIFVETGNPDKVVAKFKQTKVPGSQYGGYDFDVGSRVAESYAYAGKYLAKRIAKELK